MAPNAEPRPAEPAAPELWRGLEEWMDTPEFREMMRREFPDNAAEWTDPVTRRQFLSLMGASLALAGVVGCSPRPAPPRQIMPYVHQPEQITLGNSLYFATAMPMAGAALGLLVESREGRPIKVEGNPDHPGSLGGTDVFAQASILDLYDPDRSQVVTHLGAPRSWDDALGTLRDELVKRRAAKGAGVRVLTDTVASPTLAALLEGLLEDYPEAKWVQYDPAGRDAARAGSRRAFGRYVDTVYDFSKADVVLSLDADFLTSGPGSVRYARDFMARRRVRSDREDGIPAGEMNRLYVVETMVTGTGAAADHRLPLKPGEIDSFARALARELGVPGAPEPGPLPDIAKRWIAPLAKDLKAAGAKSLVIPGETQSPFVHALAHAINHALGNVGPEGTVRHIAPVEARPDDQTAALARLAEEMAAGAVEVLLILAGNPVYSAPADLKFAEAMEKVPLRAHFGLYQDETAVRCHWHLPASHFLESWGDARAYDGTASIIQPLIAPLYDTRSVLEVLAFLTERPRDPVTGAPLSDGREIVAAHWRQFFQKQKPEGEFQIFWENALKRGVVPGTASPPAEVKLAGGWADDPPSPGPGRGFELAFRPDPTVYDGRFANNGWLQELPKPLTKITWDNVALMSPGTARQLGVSVPHPRWTAGEHGRMEADTVRIRRGDAEVTAAAWEVPGMPDGVAVVTLGYGRRRAGRVGNGTGFNAYLLRTSDSPWLVSGIDPPQKTGETFLVACTQAHHSMEGRKPVRSATLAEFARDPYFAKIPPAAANETDLIYRTNVPGSRPPPHEHGHDHDHDHSHEHDHENGDHENGHDRRLMPLTLYPDLLEGAQRKWAMAIDLTACMGCNACIIACQAENNIPVVGKEEVTRGREMHWLRVDRYYRVPAEAGLSSGERLGQISAHPEAVEAFFQPIPCQQCEKAPCE
ncbi:MAG TPA: TAT-variant-translocated molybdopterin oxidoreductase, partial [Gemmataceae bacterium]